MPRGDLCGTSNLSVDVKAYANESGFKSRDNDGYCVGTIENEPRDDSAKYDVISFQPFQVAEIARRA